MKNFFRTIIILCGFGIGPGILALCEAIWHEFSGDYFMQAFTGTGTLLMYFGSAVLTGIIFIFLSSPIIDSIVRFSRRLEDFVSKMDPRTAMSGVIGLVIGLFLAFLISSGLLSYVPGGWLHITVSFFLYILLGYLAMRFMIKIAPRIARSERTDKSRRRKFDSSQTSEDGDLAQPKILDTSVIIDGRILDILETGIIEGRIIIPECVLSELRHIADSDDSLKRGKGRRGLDILNKIQKELPLNVEIHNEDSDAYGEVDEKLLRLARELGAKVITNDFNLNKVAAVQSVKVLNINDLSNAVKPVLLPGEEIFVTIVKEGKEYGQGVAYLDDGTMIVIENGRNLIGKSVSAVVTSVLQTSAGRMIFARVRE